MCTKRRREAGLGTGRKSKRARPWSRASKALCPRRPIWLPSSRQLCASQTNIPSLVAALFPKLESAPKTYMCFDERKNPLRTGPACVGRARAQGDRKSVAPSSGALATSTGRGLGSLPLPRRLSCAPRTCTTPPLPKSHAPAHCPPPTRAKSGGKSIGLSPSKLTKPSAMNQLLTQSIRHI